MAMDLALKGDLLSSVDESLLSPHTDSNNSCRDGNSADVACLESERRRIDEACVLQSRHLAEMKSRSDLASFCEGLDDTVVVERVNQ